MILGALTCTLNEQATPGDSEQTSHDYEMNEQIFSHNIIEFLNAEVLCRAIWEIN